MRKFNLFLLVVLSALAAGIMFCSCQFLAKDEKVRFELPEWPENLPELVGWKVQGAAYSPRCKSITLRLPRNEPCCIIATPVTKKPFFKPAGTIYPYSQKITWSGGYAVKIYNTIPEHGQFNWEKLLDALEECPNPWLLDSQKVLEGIAFHNFNANKLKLSGAISVQLDFMVYSSYVPENQAFLQNNTVTVIKNQPELFALSDFAVIICASSAKNISLDLVSMPIFKEGL